MKNIHKKKRERKMSKNKDYLNWILFYFVQFSFYFLITPLFT